MICKFLDKNIKYDGSQLRSLYAFREHQILGNSLVSWIGPCDVAKEFMVDGEDLNANEKICGDLMLHFILERFETSLVAMVAIQRLMSSIALDVLKDLSQNQEMSQKLFRSGDDLYLNTSKFKNTELNIKNELPKLSISIATVSPVSGLVHFAMNVTNIGTPVKTLSLQDLECDPNEFVKEYFHIFGNEMQSLSEATQKVHWVK